MIEATPNHRSMQHKQRIDSIQFNTKRKIKFRGTRLLRNPYALKYCKKAIIDK